MTTYFICKYTRDGETYSLWQKDHYWYELTNSLQSTGYRFKQEWHKIPLEEVQQQLTDAGYVLL